MNGTSVQVHYTGDKAKAYHWSDKGKQVADPAKETTAKEPAKEAMKPEDFMKQAADYAKENIKNTNQREAFLKHLGNVTEQAFNKQQPEATKTMPAPVQAKQADTGIER